MSLGCKVHYCVNGLSDEKEVDKVSTANVSLDKLKVRGWFRGKEVLEIRTVIKLVKHNNLVVWVIPDKPVSNMGCNESSSPRNEDVLGCVCSHIKAESTKDIQKKNKIQNHKLNNINLRTLYAAPRDLGWSNVTFQTFKMWHFHAHIGI